MLSQSGGFAAGFTAAGPVIGIALAAVLRACDSFLPYEVRLTIFLTGDSVSSIFTSKESAPLESGTRKYVFEGLRWCATSAVLAHWMPASGDLTILAGSHLIFDRLWGSWLEYIRSDGPQGKELAGYTLSRNFAMFYVCTALLLSNARSPLHVIGQIVRPITVTAICLAVTLSVVKVLDLSKYLRKLANALLGVWLLILFTMLYLYDRFDVLEAILLYYLPKLIRGQCEWVERGWIRVRRIPRYEYKKNKLGSCHIRLLRLERRSIFSGMVRAQLALYQLDNLPPYEALSYRWEDENPRSILIDGKLFFTTVSAHELLLARSSVWRPRLVWIDAVCINQEDDVEKSNQVRLMRDIYQNAKRVVVWLGQSYRARLASATLLDIFLTSIRTGSSGMKLKFWSPIYGYSPRWFALLELFRKSYFERVWVVQEVAVASNVQLYHGGSYVPWHILMRVIVECGNSDNITMLTYNEETGTVTSDYPSFENAAVMASLNRESEFRSSGVLNLLELVNILSLCRKFKSCDPRDKVFALLGLVPDQVSKHPLLTADYQKPARDVFRDTAEYILSHCEKPLVILHYAGIGYFNNTDNVSSWAPRWRGDEFIGTPLIGPVNDYDKLQNYHAATALDAVIQFESKDILLLKSSLLDTISAVTSVLAYPVDERLASSLFEVVRAKHNWHEEAYHLAIQKSPDSYLNGQPQYEAFWRTLIGDRSPTTHTTPMSAQYYAIWATNLALGAATSDDATLHTQMQRGFDQDNPQYKYLTEPCFSKGVGDYSTALTAASRGRRFAVTERGYMGLVPPGAEVGDLVCVIWGAETPILIRRCQLDGDSDETNDPLYQLVGECYIHGVMAGELLEWKPLKSKMVRLV